MNTIRLFLKMYLELRTRMYEMKKEYWKFRSELEIYKQERLRK